MVALWRIRFDGKEIGPYAYPVFLLLRSQGRMPPNTEARREGSADWGPFDAASEDPDARSAAIPPSLPAPSIALPPPLPQRRHADTPQLPLRGNARQLAADKAQPKNFWPAFTGFAVLPLLLLATAAVVAIDHSRSAYDPRPWMAFTVSISALIVAHWFGSSWWICAARRAFRARQNASAYAPPACSMA